MRMYAPESQSLEALRRSNIELVLDVPNDELQFCAKDYDSAQIWVQNNVGKYSRDVNFRIIAVGNAVNPNPNEPTYHFAQYVLPAMKNIYTVIVYANWKDTIKVSTAMSWDLLRNSSYPPSHGTFQGDAESFMAPIIGFLNHTNNPLLVNIYPYFSHIADPQNMPLSYALFTDQRNLFDAMLDATYSAVEKVGGSNVKIVVSESGWPSEGGLAASPVNAETYYKNLMNHVKGDNESPKRPGKPIEIYLFAMFDENNKTGVESEKHFGLFSHNKTSKYQLSFN